MSEEPTERLEGASPFEARVLMELASLSRQMAAMDSRLAALERGQAALERGQAALERGQASLADGQVALGERLTSLEEKVEARLRETRPIWESVLTRLDSIDSKIEVLGLDILEMRGEVNLLKKRTPPAA